ncbi:MAG TPA: DUF6165 family protein [Rhizomicrobium sp.]|nr:DUF6165 family protein [Rhizomicrobium sp.]
MRVYVPVSAGDLIDRITILRIKMEQIPDAATVARIGDELEHLTAIRNCFAKLNTPAIAEKETALHAANKTLWDAENRVRVLEAKSDFGTDFVAAARSIYRGNGERAQLKREINELAGSALREEKWFSDV